MLKYICLISFFLINSCNFKELQNKLENVKVDKLSFSISDFKCISNFGNPNDSISNINIDFTDAINGIEIPTKRQTTSGYFVFSFKLKNNTNELKDFFYKMYYQNETYKFLEQKDTILNYFKYQEENFYGSWADSSIAFRRTIKLPNDGKYHQIVDSFRIVGNPRFDHRYYKNGINDKWKRNPRVGNYEFLLAVCTEDVLQSSIPNFLQNICLKNNEHYVNPFDYFTYRIPKEINDLAISRSYQKLKVTAKLDNLSGIYVDSGSFVPNNSSTFYCETCGTTEKLYKSACFKQFKPFVLEDNYFDNIPLIADVNNDEYNRVDYYWNKSFISQRERIRIVPRASRTACENVKINKQNGSIIIKNPGSKEFDWKKENTGIITRHGLTYGKYFVKCKLTRLLNKENMWNGITNSIWMIGQENEPWNYRRVCTNGGYIPDYLADEHAKLIPQTAYSEIDFEIMKSLPYCPNNEFPPFFKQTKADNTSINAWLPQLNEEFKKSEDMVHVTCTNWDMGCKDASRYAAGCVPCNYGGKVHESFRWSEVGSRGVSGGKMEKDKELFGGEYYFFEIEWNPKEIIWRVGPQKNNMHVVCYMDSSFTNIPNNQMLLIIDQEYHNTKWWFGAPFEQWNIPFSRKDIEGIIYEVSVE